MWRGIVGLVLGLGFVGTMVYVSLDQASVTCEVCMVYQGRQACEGASGPDRATAQMQATNAACVQISSGVTDGIQCNDTPPRSLQCTE